MYGSITHASPFAQVVEHTWWPRVAGTCVSWLLLGKYNEVLLRAHSHQLLKNDRPLLAAPQAAALAEECSSALEELLKQEQSVAESLRLALTHADEATADIAASAMAMRRGETHAVDEIRSAKAEVAQTAQKVVKI